MVVVVASSNEKKKTRYYFNQQIIKAIKQIHQATTTKKYETFIGGVFNLRAKEERGQDEEKMLFFVARKR